MKTLTIRWAVSQDGKETCQAELAIPLTATAVRASDATYYRFMEHIDQLLNEVFGYCELCSNKGWVYEPTGQKDDVARMPCVCQKP
mgnify:CR=1 FL=1